MGQDGGIESRAKRLQVRLKRTSAHWPQFTQHMKRQGGLEGGRAKQVRPEMENDGQERTSRTHLP